MLVVTLLQTVTEVVY